MRQGIALLIVAGAAFVLNVASAFPDGAPWGAANPSTEQHCATCHFGADPELQSQALRIEGLPSNPQVGKNYELIIVFDDPQIVTAGYQLIVDAADDNAGLLSSPDEDTEFLGGAIRSTSPARNENGIRWNVAWQVPADSWSTIRFYLAASAANDDGSPFGDTIHYRSYELTNEKTN